MFIVVRCHPCDDLAWTEIPGNGWGWRQGVDTKNDKSYQLHDHASQDLVKSYGVVDSSCSLFDSAVEMLDLTNVLIIGSQIKVYLQLYQVPTDTFKFVIHEDVGFLEATPHVDMIYPFYRVF